MLSIKLSRATSSNILSTEELIGLKKLRSIVSRVGRDAPLTFKVSLWALFDDLGGVKASSTARWLSEKVDLVFDLEGDAYVIVPFYVTKVVGGTPRPKPLVLDLIGSLASSLGTEALIRKEIAQPLSEPSGNAKPKVCVRPLVSAWTATRLS